MNLAGVLPWIHWRGLRGPGAARRRQRLLHGLSVPAAADARPPLAAGRRGAGRAGCGASGWRCVLLVALPLGVRGVRPLGQPLVDGLDRLGYFAAAFVIDGFFRGASFCKYVCPIGQFNFVQSLVSPLEVKVRDPRRLRVLPDQGLHPRQRRHSRLRAAACSSRARRATWTARSASTASTPARTTTSASSPGRPATSCGTTASARASAGSAGAPTWRPWSWCWSSAPSPTPRAWSARSWSGRSGSRRPSGVRSPARWSTSVLPRSPSSCCLLLIVGGDGTLSRRWGRLGGEHAGGGDALRLRPGAPGLRHVAGALQLSFPDELRHRDPGRRSASPPTSGWPAWASRRGAARCCVRSRTGCSPGVPFWTWACSCRFTPATASPGPGVRAVPALGLRLGAAPGAPVRRGGLDRAPADADARHDGRGGMTASHFCLRGWSAKNFQIVSLMSAFVAQM